jgi:hypothetical protein
VTRGISLRNSLDAPVSTLILRPNVCASREIVHNKDLAVADNAPSYYDFCLGI